MPHEVYEAHRAEFRAMIEILLDSPDRRKLRRLLAISEQGRRDDTIGEVFATPYGALFVARVTNDDAKGYRDERVDNRQSKLRAVEPITGDPDQTFEMSSRRGQFLVSASAVTACVEAGRSRIALRPGVWTRVIPGL